jgi:coenzyme F420-0:L-glutamate ligase/coenzyme F420-1:gamma-L-glutamate ligase
MIQLAPVAGIPEVTPGDALGELIVRVLPGPLHRGDVLVVAQKVVSKAEGRLVRLDTITPSEFAVSVARTLGGKDARLIEIILGEAKRIVRMDHGVLIVETHQGFVCANGGVDLSNVDGGTTASLLPLDADRSAGHIARAVEAATGIHIPVIISDTFGRPWREGLVDVAIGVHGMAALRDYRHQSDPHGYTLRATVLAEADQLAAAAGLLFRKNSGVPACIIRGFDCQEGEGGVQHLIRNPDHDLFR